MTRERLITETCNEIADSLAYEWDKLRTLPALAAHAIFSIAAVKPIRALLAELEKEDSE